MAAHFAFGKTPPKMEGTAEFDLGGRLRWTLTRRWGPGPTILWCGCNPNAANAQRDGFTLRRQIQFSRCWGYGGLIKTCLYPIVARDVRACRAWAEGRKSEIHVSWRDHDVPALLERNLEVIADAARRADFAVAAWGAGAGAWDPSWIAQVVAAIERTGKTIHCLGTTENGAPIHPASGGRRRVAEDRRPTIWKMQPAAV
jgi:hypothetical protein